MTHPPETADPKAVNVRVGAAKCARCDNPVQPRTRPFCSQRCADLDLAGFLAEIFNLVAVVPGLGNIRAADGYSHVVSSLAALIDIADITSCKGLI